MKTRRKRRTTRDGSNIFLAVEAAEEEVEGSAEGKRAEGRTAEGGWGREEWWG